MTLVVDASVVVAALVDGGPAGEWSAAALRGERLMAPELLPFEVANVLWRLESGQRLPPEMAALAHHDLLRLDVALWPYIALAEAAWRQRGSLSLYDASYVSLAQRLDAPLVTLDERLARAATGLCAIHTPPRRE